MATDGILCFESHVFKSHRENQLFLTAAFCTPMPCCWLLEKWLKGIPGAAKTLPSLALSVPVRKKAGWYEHWGYLWWILLMSFDNLFSSSSRYMKDYNFLTLKVTFVMLVSREVKSEQERKVSFPVWSINGQYLVLLSWSGGYVAMFINREKEWTQT